MYKKEELFLQHPLVNFYTIMYFNWILFLSLAICLQFPLLRGREEKYFYLIINYNNDIACA